MTRAEIEGLCERLLWHHEHPVHGGLVLRNPGGPEAATALRAMLAREEAMREALAEINRRASPHPDRTLGECADELVRIAAVARYHLAQGDE